MLTASVLMPAASLMPRRVEAGVERVGERELAEPLHRLGDDEQRDDPAGEVADRVQEAVVAVEGDHAADAEERRGREIVAGERDAVDEPGNLPVGGEVAGRRLGLLAEVEAEAERDGDERDEDDDGQRRRFVRSRPASRRVVTRRRSVASSRQAQP